MESEAISFWFAFQLVLGLFTRIEQLTQVCSSCLGKGVFVSVVVSPVLQLRVTHALWKHKRNTQISTIYHGGRLQVQPWRCGTYLRLSNIGGSCELRQLGPKHAILYVKP
jgi:hypothetical protein